MAGSSRSSALDFPASAASSLSLRPPIVQTTATAAPSDASRRVRRQPSTIERSLSDEILLRIWQYLDAVDLARLQCVCRRLGSLAGDPQIWKGLFLRAFVEGVPLSSAAERNPETLAWTHPKHLVSSRHPISSTGSGIGGVPAHYFLKHGKRIRNLSVTTQTPCPRYEEGGDLSDWRQGSLDWQALFRVSSNWQKGNFALSELPLYNNHMSHARPTQPAKQNRATRSPQSSPFAPSRCDHSSVQLPAERPERANTLVESVGDYLFTASRLSDTFSDETNESFSWTPCVRVYRVPPSFGEESVRSGSTSQSDRLPLLCSIKPQRMSTGGTDGQSALTITDIKADAKSSGSDVRLFVAYSTGDWSIFRIQGLPAASIELTDSLAITEVSASRLASRASDRVEPVVMSAFEWPILATCSAGFTISVFGLGRLEKSAELSAEPECPMLLRQMKSLSCHWPATMSLTEIPITQSERPTSERLQGGRKRKRPDSQSSGEKRDPRREPNASSDDVSPAKASSESSLAFRLDIAYSSASYPDNWSICLQEVIIILSRRDGARSRSMPSRYAAAPPRLTSQFASKSSDAAQDLIAFQRAPSTLVPSEHMAPASPASSHIPAPRSIFSPPLSCRLSQASRNRITSITNDGGHLVVGSLDNVLDVFEISGSIDRIPISALDGSEEWNLASQELKLDHRKVLYGHSGSVKSVASSGHRIVSGGADGNIMVWSSNQCRLASPVGIDAHVVTLRPPGMSSALHTTHLERPTTLCSLMSRWRAESQCRFYRENDLQSIAKETPFFSAKRNIVKWVSTSFDRVLSISGPPGLAVSTDDGDTCISGVRDEEGWQEERVQIWSFAA